MQCKTLISIRENKNLSASNQCKKLITELLFYFILCLFLKSPMWLFKIKVLDKHVNQEKAGSLPFIPALAELHKCMMNGLLDLTMYYFKSSKHPSQMNSNCAKFKRDRRTTIDCQISFRTSGKFRNIHPAKIFGSPPRG